MYRNAAKVGIHCSGAFRKTGDGKVQMNPLEATNAFIYLILVVTYINSHW